MESEAITAFRRLFVPPAKRHGAQGDLGWRHVHEAVSDADLRAHLEGGPVIGMSPAYRRGASWEAWFIALEVDIADLRTRDLLAAREQVLGFDGHRAWAAVRAASEDLGIPGAHWTGAYSGRRSLHLWLLPEDPLPLGDAHAIAKALVAGAAEHGVHVCTACPTSPDAWGMIFRLPWGRHPRGSHGHLVDLGLWELRERPPYPTDAHALNIIASRRVPHENLQSAADIARVRRPPVSLGGAPPEDTPRVHLPDADLRITRPCIAALLRRGAHEGQRHNMALLLRAELKATGFTVDEALPLVLRYAQACTPPWDPREAEYDTRHNWAGTDPAQRHVCPGGGCASRLTHRFHERECLGKVSCAAHRLGMFMHLWGARLSGNAKALYAALCAQEVGFARRPGDEVHTTVQQLQDEACLTTRTFKAARRELEAAGLVSHRRISRGRGHGVHSVYRRTIPMPFPVARRELQGTVNGASTKR